MKLVPGGTARMKKTAGGARSTRESELEKLRGVHPIIDEISNIASFKNCFQHILIPCLSLQMRKVEFMGNLIK